MLIADQPWPTFSSLVLAHKKCRQRKRPSKDQLEFEFRLGKNICALHESLLKQTWTPRLYTSFIVEKPRVREIFAAHFADRIVHHLVVNELMRWWDGRFAPQSFACRAGFGPHRALAAMQRHVRRISCGGRQSVWVLQLDIANFFPSLSRPILETLIIPDIRNPKLSHLVETILRHDPRNHHQRISPSNLYSLLPENKRWNQQPAHKGLPIGNLTSQLFANICLTDLDHFIARSLKPEAYFRYMDDLTLMDRDREKLAEFISPIANWLRNHRDQELNHQKTVLKNLRDGIEYLGFQIRQENSPAEPAQIYLPPRKKFELLQDALLIERVGLPERELLDPAYFIHSEQAAHQGLAALNSRLGMASHARTYRLRRGILRKLGRKRRVCIRNDFAAVNP